MKSEGQKKKAGENVSSPPALRHSVTLQLVAILVQFVLVPFGIAFQERFTIGEAVRLTVLLMTGWRLRQSLLCILLSLAPSVTKPFLPLSSYRVNDPIGIWVWTPERVIAPIPEWVVVPNHDHSMRCAYNSGLCISRSYANPSDKQNRNEPPHNQLSSFIQLH